MTVRADPPMQGEGAAVDLLAALYPPPFAVQAGAGRFGAAPTATKAAWAAIPSVDNPKLLVPIGSRSAATRTMRRQLNGRRLRTRMARAGLTLATGTGALMRMPRLRIVVAGPSNAPSIEDPLREVLGVGAVRLTMPVGPPRSNRKPVLQVTDGSGQVLAFAKVGHNPLTQRLVRQEGDALRALGSIPFHDVRIPRVVAALEWSGYDVLVLEPLDIPSRRLTGEAGRRRLLSVVLEVAAIGGRGPVPWAQHPLRAALLARSEQCGDQAARLRHEVGRISLGVSLATGSWHGDLNSGNVALVPGRCPVWDWERFDSDVPVGFDLLHHDLHESITTRGVPARLAATRLLRTATATLAPLGVDPNTADAVARSYLLTLACRYLADDQRGAGGALGRVDEWLLPALEEVRS